MEFKTTAKLFNRLYGFLIHIESKPYEDKPVVAMANRCKDGMFVVFLDYERVKEEWVIDEAKRLQEQFRLGWFYVFRTGRGFHLVCVDKLPLRKLLEVMRESSCDVLFMDVPITHGLRTWALRVSEKDGKKPEFVWAVKSEWNVHRKSYAHIWFIKRLYGICMDEQKHDGEKELIYVEYKV